MMFFARFLPVFAVLVLCVAAYPAQASKTVTSASVKEGEFGAEWKGEYTVDDRNSRNGAWRHKAAFGYGVTPFWQTEIEVGIGRGGSRHADVEFSSVDWKNKIQFTDQDSFGLDTGARVTYGFSGTGGADEIELKLLAARDMESTAHRANMSVSREVGEDSADEWNWGLSWHSRYKYADGFQPGIEIYSEFGEIGNAGGFHDQDHRIGPVASGKLPVAGMSYDVGYLFGASDSAPDGTVKAILKYRW